MNRIKYSHFVLILVLFSLGSCANSNNSEYSNPPNILWIVVEDASSHISCYGETAIETPTIDMLASEGIRFENAFVTCPVCSPSRSAMVTGMYQTTIGAHNHRSQRTEGKGATLKEYHSTYMLPPEIPYAGSLFEKAGYYTSNQTDKARVGKEDYNFVLEKSYDGNNWKACPEDKPFFAQIQLKGGKNRTRTADTEDFSLPPYYYEDEVMRNDWKRYLGSWLDMDRQLKTIVKELKESGRYDNTLMFFFSDHGISHLRGKQFLYDEGMKVPLIVKLPGSSIKSQVRSDQVEQIDILATSLEIAGIPVPENMQGVNFLADNYKPKEYVFSARDRCDETTEIIRAARSLRYKYIRNFLSYRPHSQRNQYKDGKEISIHMRELYETGKLNELQSSFYSIPRPTEELYDLLNDPQEINNLAKDPKHKSTLLEMREVLYNWMKETRDPGLVPEPILEDWGMKYGSKYQAMTKLGTNQFYDQVFQVIHAGEQGNIDVLVDAIGSGEPVERYWGCTWLGNNQKEAKPESVRPFLKDPDPSVRIAANLALFKLQSDFDPVPGLSKEMDHPNRIVGMYALSAIEQTGIRNDAVRKIASEHVNSDYEFSKRYARYLESVCQ